MVLNIPFIREIPRCTSTSGKYILWNGLKRYIAELVAKCRNCQQVKVQHQRLGGLSNDIAILPQKWEDANMDFVFGLPCT